jgi:hypothetical protein
MGVSWFKSLLLHMQLVPLRRGVVAKLPEHEKPAGAYYVKVMTKSIAKGADYPKTEAGGLCTLESS